MSFFLNALLILAFGGFMPQASAYVVYVHHGISDTTRIIIIVVCIVIFFLLLACRLARVRQNRRAAQANATIIPITTQPNTAHYASQGPGGYNGYTLPPPPQGQGQYPPSQGYPQNYVGQAPYGQAYTPGGYAPPAYGPGDAEKAVGTPPAMTDINVNVQQYPSYAPPAGPPPPGGAAHAPAPALGETFASGFYSPPPGPPPATGYDATPLSPVPPAHTTGQDHAGTYHSPH
ncbi:hypothetical protein C8R43DRAFT_943834 [Mycena crocata]|nr:hypothetical protein C8R43DRAFT_943834 [Mycena crocata]